MLLFHRNQNIFRAAGYVEMSTQRWKRNPEKMKFRNQNQNQKTMKTYSKHFDATWLINENIYITKLNLLIQ